MRARGNEACLQVALHQGTQCLVRAFLLRGRSVGHHVLHASDGGGRHCSVDCAAALHERNEDVKVTAGI